jgi:hypothetical protein
VLGSGIYEASKREKREKGKKRSAQFVGSVSKVSGSREGRVEDSIVVKEVNGSVFTRCINHDQSDGRPAHACACVCAHRA